MRLFLKAPFPRCDSCSSLWSILDLCLRCFRIRRILSGISAGHDVRRVFVGNFQFFVIILDAPLSPVIEVVGKFSTTKNDIRALMAILIDALFGDRNRKPIIYTITFICLLRHCRLRSLLYTIVQNSQKSRCNYWATYSSIRLFTRITHSFAFSPLLASLVHSAALICTLARSLLSLWYSERLDDGLIACFDPYFVGQNSQEYRLKY